MKTDKLVIFDLDGTLFRTETVDIRAINEALADSGLDKKSEEEILGIIGYTLEEAVQRLTGSTSSETIGKISRKIIELEAIYIDEYGELYEGTLEFLRRLKDYGCKLCICSNGNKEYVIGISGKFDFKGLFEEICYSSGKLTKSQSVGKLKRKFGADKFIMIGDRSSDIEAARENGGTCIGVTYGFGGNEVLSADYIASSLKEVEDKIKLFFNT